jgi:hypothetical protein
VIAIPGRARTIGSRRLRGVGAALVADVQAAIGTEVVPPRRRWLRRSVGVRVVALRTQQRRRRGVALPPVRRAEQNGLFFLGAGLGARAARRSEGGLGLGARAARRSEGGLGLGPGAGRRREGRTRLGACTARSLRLWCGVGGRDSRERQDGEDDRKAHPTSTYVESSSFKRPCPSGTTWIDRDPQGHAISSLSCSNPPP